MPIPPGDKIPQNLITWSREIEKKIAEKAIATQVDINVSGSGGGGGGTTAHTFNDISIHTGFATYIDQTLKTTDNVEFNQLDIGDTGMFKLLSLTVDRTTGGSTVTDKEMWILANAYYNSSDGCFYRVDNTATAFGLQVQGKGTIPGEEAISTINQGYVIWRCTPNIGTPTDKIGALVGSTWTTFGVYYGWELGFLFDSFRNLVIGGFGIEIDGSGTFPFGRIIHELTSGAGWGQTFTGILTNLYAQINGGQDDGTKPSWFAGIEDDSFVVKRRAAASNPISYSELIELIKITNTQINLNKVTKIGDGTNYSEVEADGTLKFVGTATVYDDLRVNLSNIKAPASGSPNWTTYKSCELPAYSASAVNSLYFTAQLPHTYKQGTDLVFHIHVVYPDANTGNSVWRFTYTWANMDGTFSAETTDTLTFAAPAVADSNKLHAFTTISGTGKEISSILLCSLSRLGNNGADTYGSVIYAAQADFHYEIDTVGSRTITAK